MCRHTLPNLIFNKYLLSISLLEAPAPAYSRSNQVRKDVQTKKTFRAMPELKKFFSYDVFPKGRVQKKWEIAWSAPFIRRIPF